MQIQRINGTDLTKDDIHMLLHQLKQPTIFLNLIDGWPASKWTIENFLEEHGNLEVKFKLHQKNGTRGKIGTDKDEGQGVKESTSDIPEEQPVVKKKKISHFLPYMETDCFYEDASFNNFSEWLTSKQVHDSNPLAKYPRDNHWCYASYMYMKDLFQNTPSVWKAVDWSLFGYKEYNGEQSTLWVGSDGAYTPCHQDTYGYNLVAQICGLKQWILFSPDSSEILKATRIPFEESSIFSEVNIMDPDIMKRGLQATLHPGEVLFVPKHWWHYVECKTPSISVNTWLEHIDDSYSRVRESLVQMFVYAFNDADSSTKNGWLNPGQILPSSLTECLGYVQQAFKEHSSNVNHVAIKPKVIINSLCTPAVLDSIIEIIKNRIDQESEILEEDNRQNSVH